MTEFADPSKVPPPALPPCAGDLLLVSASRRWVRAVEAAAAELGHGVSRCDARGALVRLAGATPPRYSHLLLHPDSADGLLPALLQLSAGARDFCTEILLLGTMEAAPPRIGVIASADRGVVRQALASRSRATLAPPVPMQPAELREALADAMIETRYQPIVRMADRRPLALEALARLNHPTRGTLSPDAFVPQLEDAGLAAPLTEQVADRAFSDLVGPLLRPHRFGLTLNFPLDVLLVPEALQRIDARRRAACVAATRIGIELTESRAVEDFAVLGAAVERLRAEGYRVAIDDLCPAIPNVAQLLDLPFSSVKLDKDVVRAVATDPDMRAYVDWLMHLAQTRDLTVVAEGVEDVTTWRSMKALGVHAAQGFLVARPLPADAVPIWLEAWRSQPDFE